MSSLVVGSFPYKPGLNPYQQLITGAIEEAGMSVARIPPEKWFPLQKAFAANCDILHLDWPHDWYSGKNWASRCLKKAMYLSALSKKKKQIGNTKLVWTAHNLIAHDAKDASYEKRMIQSLVSRCDGIMVMSEASRQLLYEAYEVPSETAVQTIYHGHYADCYPNVVSSEQARNELGIDLDDQVFLSIGSIKPYKGHLELVREFSAVCKPHQRLILAGQAKDPAVRSLIQNEVNSAVESTGCRIDLHLEMVSDDRLQYYFNAADVGVLPFRSVLNSGSLLLAMSFGLPIIAPAVGSIPEVAIEEHRILYAPSDPEGLRKAILNADGIRCSQTIRQQILATTRETYSWSSIGQNLAAWYTELVSGDKG